MSTAPWWAVAGGLLGGLLWSFLLSKPIQRWQDRRMEKKFLRYIQIKFPGGKVIESISVSSTDKQAMENVERRLRDASRNL